MRRAGSRCWLSRSPLLNAAVMLQYFPSLISFGVAACLSLASYEIFDTFDEVNSAYSEISRINFEPQNTTNPTTSRPTTEITIDTDPPTDIAQTDLIEAASKSLPNTRNSTERLPNTRKASTEWLPDSTTPATDWYLHLTRPDRPSTYGLLNTSMVSTSRLPADRNMTITGLSNTSMSATEGLLKTSNTTTESALRVTVGYSRTKGTRGPTINQTTVSPHSNHTVPPDPDACPEEEKPLNIGPYEVPTQRDLVLHVRRILLHMFRSYHKKTLEVLKDMKEATKSSWPKEESCQGASKVAYRRCVRSVSNRCELAAKSLVLALEELRGDVLGLLQGKVCNIEDMNADPIQLIRILAMEKVSLEFALPGFLRLLNACTGHCSKLEPSAHSRKPLRRMSDQDLVIRHFLTQKSYSQLLKGTT